MPRPDALRGWPTPSLLARGALTGKTVYLSPGHGFVWTQLGAAFDWRTQRPNTHGLVEDLVSAETVDQFLLPLLMNAGAEVISVRESDLNSDMVIVDDGEADYLESGSTLFQTSALPGWGRPSFPMDGATLPFTLGHNRLMDAASTASSSATYTVSLGADGYHHVYVSYSSFTARVSDAHYVVRHAGGETHFRVDQRRHGGTWVFLGRFFFRAGVPAEIVVFNDSAAGTGNVSLDAVRIGGGVGLSSRGAGVSGRPRFEESARYHAQFSGAPAAVWAPSSNRPVDDRMNDVGTRSRFAAWLHEAGEDAIFLAWHTNAFNATAVGSTTYVYGPNAPDGTYDFTGVTGSDRLAQLVHRELVADLRAPSGWNQPSWKDRGIDSAYFGELNPTNNPETPAALIEVAFHDAAADAAQLKEPGFRYVAARAITQGVIKYFAERDGTPVRLPPEPPTHVSVVSQGASQALVRWRPGPSDGEGVGGDPATAYRLYTSCDGLAWDDGVVVAQSPVLVDLIATRPSFFRLTGSNGGGESFPSSVVGVRAPRGSELKVLVVNGYDRLESAIAPLEDFSPRYDLGRVLRVLVLQMNDGSLVRLHGEALDLSLVAFDSADSEAFAAGEISLAGYRLIDWAAGRGHPQGAAPSAVEQGLLAAFRRERPLLFSGTALGSASFLVDVLSASLSSSAGSRFVVGAEVLTGLATELDDGTGGSSGVGLPPAVAPLGAAVSLASYDTKDSAAVGVAGQSVFLAFPFEGLTGRAERAEVMRRVLAFLELGPPSDGGFPDSRPKSDGGADDEPDGGADEEPDGGVLGSGALHVVGSTERGCSSSGGPVLLSGGWLTLALLRRRHGPAAAAFACPFVR